MDYPLVGPTHGNKGIQTRQVQRVCLRPASGELVRPETVSAYLGFGRTSYRDGEFADPMDGGQDFIVFNDFSFQPEDPSADACIIDQAADHIHFERFQAASVENCNDSIILEDTKEPGRLFGVLCKADLSGVTGSWAPAYYPVPPAGGFTGVGFGMQFGPYTGVLYSQLSVFFCLDASRSIILSGPPDNAGVRVPELAIDASGLYGFDWSAQEAEYALVVDPTANRLYLFAILDDGTTVNLLHDEVTFTYASQADGYYDLSLGLNQSRPTVWQSDPPNGELRPMFFFNSDAAGSAADLSKLTAINAGQSLLIDGDTQVSTSLRLYPNESIRIDTQTNPRYAFPLIGTEPDFVPEKTYYGLALSGEGTEKHIHRLDTLGDESRLDIEMAVTSDTSSVSGAYVACARGGVLYALAFLDIYQEGGAEYRGKVLGFYTGGDVTDLDSYVYSSTSIGWAGHRSYAMVLDQSDFGVYLDGEEALSRGTASAWPATTLEDGWYVGDLFGVGAAWRAEIRKFVLTPVSHPVEFGNDPTVDDGYVPIPGTPGCELEQGDTGFVLTDSSLGAGGIPFYYYNEMPASYSWTHGLAAQARIQVKWYDDEDGDRLLDDQVSALGIDLDNGVFTVPMRFGSSTTVGTFVAVMPGLTASDKSEILAYSDTYRDRVAEVDWSKEHKYRLECKPGVGVFLFIDGDLKVRIDWRDIRNYLASSTILPGKLPASPGVATEVRIGSLSDTEGGTMSVEDIVVGSSNGFDLDITYELEEEEYLDDAEAVFLVDSKDTA
jgi:hypothetical protein